MTIDATTINTALLVVIAFLQLLRGHERRLQRKEWIAWQQYQRDHMEREEATTAEVKESTGKILEKQHKIVETVERLTPISVTPIKEK